MTTKRQGIVELTLRPAGATAAEIIALCDVQRNGLTTVMQSLEQQGRVFRSRDVCGKLRWFGTSTAADRHSVDVANQLRRAAQAKEVAAAARTTAKQDKLLAGLQALEAARQRQAQADEAAKASRAARDERLAKAAKEARAAKAAAKAVKQPAEPSAASKAWRDGALQSGAPAPARKPATHQGAAPPMLKGSDAMRDPLRKRSAPPDLLRYTAGAFKVAEPIKGEVDYSRAKVTICPPVTHDPRYQVDPASRPFGAGFAAAGIGRSVTTGRAWNER